MLIEVAPDEPVWLTLSPAQLALTTVTPVSGSVIVTSRWEGPLEASTLDRVDVIVIDPRALYTDELTITRVRGVSNSHRTKAWQAAQFALDDGRLGPGWHKLSTIRC